MTAPTTTTTPIIVVKDEESFRRAVGVVSFVLGLGNVVATKRLSVEDYQIYRDGTVHISREMHKQCFITRPEMTSRAPKPHRHRSRTFL